MRLDRLAEDQRKRDGRNRRHDHVEGEALLARVVGQALDHVDDLVAELPAHRQDGAELDHDLEDLALLVVEVEQLPGQDQVAGAGDGQELGQPFDDAENQRFDGECDVHAVRRKQEEWRETESRRTACLTAA